MNQAAKSLLGLMYKSQNLVFGEKVFTYLKMGKIKLIILAADIGLASERKIVNKCANIKIIKTASKIELAQALGKNNISNIGVLNEKLANKFIQIMEG